MPPLELRRQVGETDEGAYENYTGRPIFRYVPVEAYERVLDWGCGCGRNARRLMLQTPQPASYLGLDLNPAAVQWCTENLTPHAAQFTFLHQDVRNPGLNPGGSAEALPFPVEDASVSLLIGWSVFTHVIEANTPFYLGEIARVLRPDGIAVTSWMLFEKAAFPIMQPGQNALYINLVDPTNAVIYDRNWVREAAGQAGLATTIFPPSVPTSCERRILLRRRTPAVSDIEMSAADCAHVAWERAEVPAQLRAGTTVAVAVTFTNRDRSAWPDPAAARPGIGDGLFAVRLTYSWKRHGEPEGVRHRGPHTVDLSAPLLPGDTTTLRLDVRAPDVAGDYELVLELLREEVYWFADWGGDVHRVAVEIVP